MIRTVKLTKPQHSVADYRFFECAYEEAVDTTVTLTATTLSWDSADDRFVRSIIDNAEDIVADWALSGSMSPAERGERQATNTLVRKVREAMTVEVVNTNPLDIATGDRVVLTDPSSYAAWRRGHVGRVTDVVDTDDMSAEGGPETILIVRCENCTLSDGSPNNHYVSAVEVERVEVVPFQHALTVDMESGRRPDVVARFVDLSDDEKSTVLVEANRQHVSEHEAYPGDVHHALDFVENALDMLADGWFGRRGVEVPAVEVDPNPVPVISVSEAVQRISRAVLGELDTDLDPEAIASDIRSGCSFSVQGHGRTYRPNPDGTVSVFVDLSKPSDAFPF